MTRPTRCSRRRFFLRDSPLDEEKQNAQISGHGMMWETSLVLAMHPDLVDLPRARRIPESPLVSQLKNKPQENIDRIASANADLGRRVIELAAQRTAKQAQDLLP